MKDLNGMLAKKFLDTCEDIKNSQSIEDLNFYSGLACGLASALFLSDVIDIDCYTAMHLNIGVARDECSLGGVLDNEK